MKYILTIILGVFTINSFAQLKPIGSAVYHWDELPVKKEVGRESRKIAAGTTHELSYLEIHATTQFKGATPKPAHALNDMEELIIVKSGTIKCTVGNKIAELKTGDVLLIPPGEQQTIENIGNNSATYYVFKFRSDSINIDRSNKAGGSLFISSDTLLYKKNGNKAAIKYFERPTAMCANYEMHITELFVKGPSHTPHTHIDTEVILMIDGQTDMVIDGNTYTAKAGDMFIVESGKLHGITNTTDSKCSYFAFKWR